MTAHQLLAPYSSVRRLDLPDVIGGPWNALPGRCPHPADLDALPVDDPLRGLVARIVQWFVWDAVVLSHEVAGPGLGDLPAPPPAVTAPRVARAAMYRRHASILRGWDQHCREITDAAVAAADRRAYLRWREGGLLGTEFGVTGAWLRAVGTRAGFWANTCLDEHKSWATLNRPRGAREVSDALHDGMMRLSAQVRAEVRL